MENRTNEPRQTWIISLQPEWWQEILEGEKLWEFRKPNLKIRASDVVIIYSKKPFGKVVGTFIAGRVIRADATELGGEFDRNLRSTHLKYLFYQRAHRLHGLH